MKESALALARLGWHIFPIKAGHKGGPGTFHVASWKDEATADPDTVASWWDRWPDANIGVFCEPSGLAVVDVDDPESWDAFVNEHPELPPTLTATTPRGGTHCVFSGQIKTTAGKLAPGVDTRGRGGYFVAPPSSRAEGVYAWTVGGAPAPLPDWLAELADPPPEERQPTTAAAQGQANDRWGQVVLDGEIARVATSIEGSRNQTLFAAACKVFEAVKGGHVDLAVARDQLEAVALRAGLDRDEVASTLDSAYERTEPRDPAEPIRQAAVTAAPPPAHNTQNQNVNDLAFDTYDLDALSQLPPPRWLIPNLLPEGLTFMVGKEGVGKSFVALDWAATIAASGKNVLYFAGEGVAGFAQRVAAWNQAHPSADIGGLRVVPVAPQLLDPHHQQRLYTTVRDSGADLIVLDTWSRCIGGKDENDHAAVSGAIGVVDRAREAYGTSTLVIHHTNAAGERPRGHSAIGGALEALWFVRADTEMPDAYHLACQKMKDAGLPPGRVGRITKQGDSAVAYPSVFDRQGRS